MGAIAQVGDLADDLKMGVEHTLANRCREFPKFVDQWQNFRVREPQEEEEMMKKPFFEEDPVLFPVCHGVRVHPRRLPSNFGIRPVIALQQMLGEPRSIEDFLHGEEGIAPFDMADGEESSVVGGKRPMQ